MANQHSYEMSNGKAGKPGNIVDVNGKYLENIKDFLFIQIGQRKDWE